MATDSKNKQRKVATPKGASKPAKESTAASAGKPKSSKSSKKIAAPPADDASKQDAQPSKSRKRAADFFQGEDGEPSEITEEAKSEKPKKKPKTTVASERKPSKVDGHPIKTAKIHPSGDMVEVEPEGDEAQVPKGKKKKATKKEKESTSAEVAKVTKQQDEKAPMRTKKAKKEGQSTSAEGKLAEHHIVGGHDLRHSPVLEPVEKPESPEGAAKRKELHAADADETPPAPTGEGPSQTRPKRSAKSRSNPKQKVTKEADQTATINDDELMEDAIVVGSSGPPENTKAKKPTPSGKIEEKTEPKASKAAKTDKAKLPRKNATKGRDVEAPAVTKKSDKSDKVKLPKESANKGGDVEALTVTKKSEKSNKVKLPKESVNKGDDVEASTVTKGSAKSGKAKKPAEDSVGKGSTKAESSKSKKRKAPAEPDLDDKIENLVDQLSEVIEAKKPKKTRSSSIEPVGKKAKGLLSSGVEVAAQGVTAAKHYIEDLIDVTPGLDSVKGQASASETFASDVVASAPSLENVEKGADAVKGYVDDLADRAPSLETVKQGAGAVKSYVDELADIGPSLETVKQGAGTAKDYVGDLADTAPILESAKKGASAAKDYVSDLTENAPSVDAAKQTAATAKKYISNLVDSAPSLETAKRGARAAKNYVGKLADSAQRSIMSDVTEVASGAIDVKKKVEKKAAKASASKKGKGKAKDESSETQEFGGFDDGEAAKDKDVTALVEGDDEEESEEDDQTAALLKGFESSDDEDVVDGETFMQGQAIPELPHAEETSKKLKNIKGKDSEPGVVYIGRIPHGFYEHEMRAYFSQFGTIKRLRLSRNKSTGKSKHFAFIEFASAEVAEIVAATMNNYLMFNHILKCNVVPKEQVHEKLWKGANRRFKAVPWNKIQGRELEMGMGREGWEKRIQGEKKRREDKQEKLKEIGYEFEGGELKGVDTVPVKEKAKAIEEVGEIEQIQKERTVVVGSGENHSTWVTVEEVVSKKVKRGGKKEKEATLDTDRANHNTLLKSKDALEDATEGTAKVAEKVEKAVSETQKGSKKVKETKADDLSAVEDVVAGASSIAKNIADGAVDKAGKAVRGAKKNITQEKPSRALEGGVSVVEKLTREARKAAKETTAKVDKAAKAPKEAKQAKKPKSSEG